MISRYVVATLGVVAQLGLATGVHADAKAEGVALQLQPVPTREELSVTQQHYRYQLQLALEQWPDAEVFADERLLSFKVRPRTGRGSWRCAHPDAPRRQPKTYERRLSSAEGETASWSTEVDLRMYCRGRALKELAKGAEIEPMFGWQARRRKRWVARSPLNPEHHTHRIVGAKVVLDAEPEASAEGPAVLELRAQDRRNARGLSFITHLKAKEDKRWVYVRPEQYRFVVYTPNDGVAECSLEPLEVSPMRDFFRRITPRRGVRSRLETHVYCDDVFDAAGIYEVVPIVELPYDGSAYKLDALTGVVQGKPTVFRVRKSTS